MGIEQTMNGNLHYSRCINAALAVFVIVTSFLFGSQQSFAQTESEKLTRLRTIGEVKGTFESRPRGRYLTEVEVRLKNVGSVEATGIRVEAILPDGNRVQLHGPSSLGKYKEGTYEASAYEPYLMKGRIKVESSCSNCRR
ncbi:MAG: hypothetical protein KDD70_11695 [Bdellovibrionales bacterium]|nr:hypothetical protein [Bdellovibrionales bacterium]